MRRQQFLLLIAVFAIFYGQFGFGADEPLKVSGFVDAQFVSGNSEMVSTLSGTSATKTVTAVPSSFLLNQGALYFGKKLGSGEVFVDLPFTSRGATAAEFVFATGQAQAYVKQTYGFGTSWTLGTFDTIYGYELNDTKDVQFTSQGIVFGICPVTHTGLLVTHTIGSINLNLIVSNAGGKTMHTAGNSKETGFRAGWSNEQFSAGAGIMMDTADGLQTYSSSDKKASEQFIDVTATAAFGPLSLALAYDSLSNKNGETKKSDGSSATAVSGILVQASYKVNDKTDASLRYETVTGFTGPTTPAHAICVDEYKCTRSKATVGVKTKMTDDLTIKADIASNAATPAENYSSISFIDGAIAAVYKF